MERFLIVGLGNYGESYQFTKHNVGFLAIDSLCEKLNIVLKTKKFSGVFESFKSFSREFFIAKPFTYMNNSGFFVKSICQFYKINPHNILVIYDDIDTEIGKIRIRSKGSSRGHNGIKNIMLLLGTQEIKRIRIGIGKPLTNLTQHVLSNFDSDSQKLVNQSIQKAVDATIFWMNNAFEKVVSKFN